MNPAAPSDRPSAEGPFRPRRLAAAAVLGLAALLGACVQPPEYPIEPVLTFRAISATTLDLSAPEEVFLSIDFTDGDGDLGQGNAEDPDADTVKNVIVEDSRVPGFPILYHIDEVVPRSSVQAISGRIDLRFNPGFFACLNGEVADTLTLSVKVVDRAGNESNVVRTPELLLLCP
jgi:hypothetical protein